MSKKVRHPVMAATLWMMGALLSFMAMAVGARELSSELTTFQILFFRSLIGLPVVALFIARTGARQFGTRRFWLHGLRNGAHFTGQFGWFYGIAFIPLAEVFAIEFTVPVWTAIFAALLLGERITQARVAAICLGTIGTLLILRPGIAAVHPAALAVLIGAVGFGFSYALTKKLAATETALTVLFYMTLIQLPLGFVPAALQWVTPSPSMWPWLLVVGLTALTAHYCLVHAFALADATVVVPMDFMRLPLIALVGFLFYSEQISWFVFAGAVVIFAGNLINIRAERRRKRDTLVPGGATADL